MLHIPICNESKKYRIASFNAISSPVMVCDRNLKILKANEAIRNLLAFSTKELKGKPFLGFCRAQDPSIGDSLMDCLMNYTIVEYVVECNFIAKNNKLISTKTKVRGIYNPKGKLDKVMVMIMEVYRPRDASNTVETARSSIVLAQREELFEAFVRGIGQTLGVNCVMICQLSKEKHFSKVKTLWENGQIFKQMVFVNTKSPCEEMIQERGGYFVREINTPYSNNDFLKNRGYNWYAGVPIYNFRGEMIGHVSILNNEPLPDPQIVRSVLFSMTPQIGIELERVSFQQAIIDIERKYKLVLDNATDAIFVIDGDSNGIINYNQSALTLFGLTKESIDQNKSILHF